jgi:ubiquinol-cytochrome c reductase cytochrome c1 subunit
MPHVLQELQGLPTPIVEEVEENGQKVTKVVGIETDGSGEMSVDEYDQAVRDLTNFLEYVGEPTRLESEALGIKVIGFLIILFILAFMLKKEYWRDVH